LESNYRMVPGISASSIVGVGSVAMIVDVCCFHGLNRVERMAITAG
ncbi:hypothetical protein, partial [Salmonella enterica]